LLGWAVGAVRRPDVRDVHEGGAPRSETDRAVPWACLLAAELPDLDALWPSATPVLQALQAHRGPTHSLLASPLVALVAVLAVKCVFRRARVLPMFAYAWVSTVIAHLLADAWTGWGTRLFLPFSNERLSLDWTGVIDPLVTVPLLIGAVWGWRRRAQWRTAMLVAASVAALYVGARIGARALVKNSLEREHPEALQVEVFPAPTNPLRWRYVVVTETELVTGSRVPGGEARVEARHRRAVPTLPEVVAANETVREALEWARLPLLTYEPRGPEHLVRVADLRYHWGGAPTLTFVILLDAQGSVRESVLERRIPK
jgi:inner membrane protein